jgi:hypothetical protein
LATLAALNHKPNTAAPPPSAKQRTNHACVWCVHMTSALRLADTSCAAPFLPPNPPTPPTHPKPHTPPQTHTLSIFTTQKHTCAWCVSMTSALRLADMSCAAPFLPSPPPPPPPTPNTRTHTVYIHHTKTHLCVVCEHDECVALGRHVLLLGQEALNVLVSIRHQQVALRQLAQRVDGQHSVAPHIAVPARTKNSSSRNSRGRGNQRCHQDTEHAPTDTHTHTRRTSSY